MPPVGIRSSGRGLERGGEIRASHPSPRKPDQGDGVCSVFVRVLFYEINVILDPENRITNL